MECTTNHVQQLDIYYSMTSQWTMGTKISWWREGEQIPERHGNSDNRIYSCSVYNAPNTPNNNNNKINLNCTGFI